MLPAANHLPYLKVFLAISIKVLPLLDFLLHFLPRLSSFSFCSCFSLSTGDDLVVVVLWNVDELCTPHVVCRIFEETASHESASCVAAGEDAVAPTRTIGITAS